jgi:hypothetical protein
MIRSTFPKWLNWAVPIGSIVAALLAGALLILSSGNSPWSTYARIVERAFSSQDSFSATLTAATPLRRHRDGWVGQCRTGATRARFSRWTSRHDARLGAVLRPRWGDSRSVPNPSKSVLGLARFEARRGVAMNTNLFIVIAASAIYYGTPLLFAGLGELLTERSGVLNLGVEGMMLLGAVSASWTASRVAGPG